MRAGWDVAALPPRTTRRASALSQPPSISNRTVGVPNDSSPSEPAPRDDSPASEKWLVRILLALAFGLAFGIEGMTLVRSFLFDTTEASTGTAQTDARPALAEGDVLVPSLPPGVRARRLQVRATNESWAFRLTARPDSLAEHPYSLSFDRLTLRNGTVLTTAPRHTWPPADTASFTASWTLPVGQRPDALTVTATTRVSPDSTASVTRTMDLGHVPVRMQ